MPDQGRGFNDFLTEKTFNNSFNRLKNWREDGDIVVWIHTESSMFKRLLHVISYVGTREDEKTKKEVEAIKFLYFTCHEEVDDYMNKKNSDFPCRCPMCRFIEWLEDTDKIKDNMTVWEASIGDRKRDKICTKADFVGNTDAGGDWRLTFKPKLQYVLAVIDDDDLDNGIVVATETFSLIEDMKKAICQEIDRKGPEIGNPHVNPYAMKWKFNSKAKKPADYYESYPYDQATLTPEIKELLDAPALDLDGWVIPGDAVLLREIMEEHIVIEGIDVPFDIFFDNIYENHMGNRQETKEEKTETTPPPRRQRTATKPKEEPKPEPEPEDDGTVECPSCRGSGKKRGSACRVCGGAGRIDGPDDDEDASEPEPAPEPEEKKEPAKRQRRVRTPAPAPEPEPKEEEFEDECGNCGKGMPADANVCPHCHARYD